ncbi:PREDICTED: DNA mismatch repair protein Msh2-like [Nicrophorus vespilloides]|uniref:DNA mismatch repair protein Msh2-like n=1 Tax=Nicrophorus vespilloides TaxID=110193 RepID=A0ABM1MQQ7_NICVS|nr:PREDICTED: DNA mismatch repair protein Msh2-like [Nicrophorus vespilloides]
MKEGPCDKSYGIHCAKVVQFPEDVIKFATKYQEKLEDVEGMKYIKDFDPSLKRKLIDEGNGMIAKVLEDFKGIDVANLSDDDLEAKLKKLKTDLAKQDNLYIKGLIGV